MSYYCAFCDFDSNLDTNDLCECRCHLIGRGIN